MGEFELIERFFKPNPSSALGGVALTAINSVALGIGDDCALLRPSPGMQLAVSSDMLVEGRHFFADVDPAALGHKALAVNLSDLAAMGADPLGFTLALALPPGRAADAAWMGAFAQGLGALADQHACPLVGGDTTAGPLNICITVFGQLPAGQALRRDGARDGDDIWVSGHLGDARLALDALQWRLTLPSDLLAVVRQRLERPTPRLALGRALRGIASSAIDLSDGLVGDLGHVLKASHVGAQIEVDFATQLIAVCTTPTGASALLDTETRRRAVLAGGDDYELLFTAPTAVRAAVQAAGQATGTRVSRIGRIIAAPGLQLLDAQGQPLLNSYRAFDHFA